MSALPTQSGRVPNIDRTDKLRRDPEHLQRCLIKFGKLMERRCAQRAFTKLTLVITDGVPVDLVEERRAHVEEPAVDSW